MNFKHTPLNASLLALGIAGAGLSVPASALPVADGNYELCIIPNPSASTTTSVVGSDGNWNSTFSFNKVKPTVTSQPMKDNGTMITTAGGTRGSSVAGDSCAGKLSLTVTGSTFVINGAYQVDTIFGTAGGNFAQYGTSASGGGTINQTSGAMTLTPSGRLGAIDGAGGTLYDKRWNAEPAASVWNTFTTGTQTTYGGAATGSVTGQVLTSIGDLNGDGRAEHTVKLVSAGKVGDDWGPGFAGQGYVETWDARLTSIAVDTVPDAFTFNDVVNATPSTQMVSREITVNGITSPAPISVTGGEYSINGGAYTSAAGTVTNGQAVTVRHTSSALNSTTTNTTLTIGGISDTYSTTTVAAGAPPDTTPDAFSFTSQTSVALSTVVVSNKLIVSGINTATPVSISGGEYSINGGAFTSASGTISNGQIVAVRHTSSAANSTVTTTTLTIGSVQGLFTSTTLAGAVAPPPPQVPDAGPAGGGCTASGSGASDPVLAALLAAALGFFGLKRFRRERE